MGRLSEYFNGPRGGSQHSYLNQGYKFTNSTPEVMFHGRPPKSVLEKTINFDEFNKGVTAWGDKTTDQLIQITKTVFPHGRKVSKARGRRKLSRSIRPNYYKERGGAQIERIGFNLQRHGVFLQKGVGRGYQVMGQSVQKFARDPRTDRLFHRRPVNWFNATMDRNIPELRNILVKHTGDAIVLNTKRIYIL